MWRVVGILLLAQITWQHPALAQVDAASLDFPTLSGRVVDRADILPMSTQQQLEQQLAAHEAQTSNQIVVATVPSLQGYDIADYGVRLARHWGIGTQEKSNGVVLLVAPEQRKVRIEVGYGLEGALPDGMAGHIIRTRILPAFRKDDYSVGIRAGVNAILTAIEGEYEYDPTRNNAPSQSTLNAVVPIVFIGIVLISQVARRRLGNRRVAQAVIPGGFGGMVGLIISSNPFTALAMGLGLFALVYRMNRRSAEHSGSAGYHRHLDTLPSERMSRGGGHDGGFSGGGGGFGGGGASGGW